MKKSAVLFIWLAFLLLIAAGCNLPQQPAGQPTEEPTEVIEPTELPTETPTPLPEREKVAFLPSDEVPGITENLTRALDKICNDNFECVTISSPDAIPEGTDFVIFAKEPTALSSLTQRFPQTGFIVVTAPGTKTDYAWTIEYDEAFLPFLAGLAAAGNAADWRCAGMLPNDSLIWGSHAEEAFLNGAHYLCGNCMPKMSPFVSFPLVVSLPGTSDPGIWSGQFDEIQKNFIYTVFLSDEAASETILQKMVSLNVQMIGVSDPPAGYEANWLASIRFDWAMTLEQIMMRFQAGEKQGTLPAILSIKPGMLRDRFSDGRARVLQEAYADLLSGKLSPYAPANEYSGQ